MLIISHVTAPAVAQDVLPTVYDSDRFIVTPVSEGGQELSFFTDTGGGMFIFADVAERLNLKVVEAEEFLARTGFELPAEMLRENGGRFVELPVFRADAWIPSAYTPWGESNLMLLLPTSDLRELGIRDGMLGHFWFADRVWTFDYPNRRLILHSGDESPTPIAGERMALGFQTDAAGNRQSHYPRMQITVNGESLDMLFDTGASSILSRTAVDIINDGGAATRATSFITANVFDRWMKDNPEWRVIDDAEQGSRMPMIEARNVAIAGYPIGAVWFTRRSDSAFHDFMSALMDKKVEGAVGGNALRNFRVTLDYPNAVAYFQRP